MPQIRANLNIGKDPEGEFKSFLYRSANRLAPLLDSSI